MTNLKIIRLLALVLLIGTCLLSSERSIAVGATAPQAVVVDRLSDHDLIQVDKLDLSTSSGDTIQLLQRERRWASTEQQRTLGLLNTLRARSLQPPLPVPLLRETDYQAKIVDIDAKIRSAESKQSDTENREERERVAAQLELVELTRQRARLDIALSETRSYLQAKSNYDNEVEQESQASKRLAQVESYLASVDDAVTNLMVLSQSQNRFRLWIGGAFTVLVGLVIVGFFYVAAKNEHLRDGFLANDRGLQFVTLFSLIIAIILFGVMNILEGRELSALLGGLSGYILGRSNRSEHRAAHGADKKETHGADMK